MTIVAIFGLGLGLGAGLLGCSKSRCEKYADLSVDCGNYPEKERDIDRKMANGMCEASKDDSMGSNEMAVRFRDELKCADAANGDCVAFNACVKKLDAH